MCGRAEEQHRNRLPGKISGILLLSPYRTLGDVTQWHFPWLPARWLIRDNDFESAHYLEKYRGLVGLLIDGEDEIVPASSGRQLFAAYAGPKRLSEHPTGRHLELGRPPDAFWRSVVVFWHAEGKTVKK